MGTEEILEPKSDEEILESLLKLEEPDDGVILDKLTQFGKEDLFIEYLKRKI